MHPDNLRLEDELDIIWLQPRERYAYLRESRQLFSTRQLFPKNRRPSQETTDGGPLAHLVAYAVLKPSASSAFSHSFLRRYWWVKTYDRFDGHGTDQGTFYDVGGPCEAVKTTSIQVGKPSEEGWDEAWAAPSVEV